MSLHESCSCASILVSFYSCQPCQPSHIVLIHFYQLAWNPTDRGAWWATHMDLQRIGHGLSPSLFSRAIPGASRRIHSPRPLRSAKESGDYWGGLKDGIMLERQATDASPGVRTSTGTVARPSPLFFPVHLPPKWTSSGRSPHSGPHLQGRLYLNIPDK